MPTAGSACYFFIIIFIRHETTAAARWALPLIVCTLFNDAIAVALWTDFGFHVRLSVALSNNASRGIAISLVSISDIEYEIEAGVEVVASIRYPH